jgi:hypothetical protein
MKNQTLLILAAGLVAAGIVSLLADRAVHARERSVAGWSPAEAAVLSVAIDRRTGAAGAAGFAPVVDYRFTAGGIQYRGSRLGFDRDWSPSQDAVRQWVQPLLDGVPFEPGQAGGMFGSVFAALPVGKRITIYYDPADPGRNIADRRDPGATGLFKWLGLFLVGLGMAALAAGIAPVLIDSSRKPRATWVGDITRREEQALPQDRVALAAQLALDMAFDATVRFARGGPDPRVLLKERFPSLSEPQIDETLGKARVLESVCYGAAARVKSGMTGHEDAVSELSATYPGFSEQTYRAALSWGLQQCRSGSS